MKVCLQEGCQVEGGNRRQTLQRKWCEKVGEALYDGASFGTCGQCTFIEGSIEYRDDDDRHHHRSILAHSRPVNMVNARVAIEHASSVEVSWESSFLGLGAEPFGKLCEYVNWSYIKLWSGKVTLSVSVGPFGRGIGAVRARLLYDKNDVYHAVPTHV